MFFEVGFYNIILWLNRREKHTERKIYSNPLVFSHPIHSYQPLSSIGRWCIRLLSSLFSLLPLLGERFWYSFLDYQIFTLTIKKKNSIRSPMVEMLPCFKFLLYTNQLFYLSFSSYEMLIFKSDFLPMSFLFCLFSLSLILSVYFF